MTEIVEKIKTMEIVECPEKIVYIYGQKIVLNSKDAIDIIDALNNAFKLGYYRLTAGGTGVTPTWVYFRKPGDPEPMFPYGTVAP